MKPRNVLMVATLALMGAIASSSPAVLADGMPVSRRSAPPLSPIYQTYDWSGFYMGGHVGIGFGLWDWTLVGANEHFEQTDTTFAGGGHAGLQKQWGHLLLGVEASYTWTEFDQATSSAVIPGLSFLTNMSNLVTVTGRLGATQDNMLAYVKAGWASADVEFTSRVAGVVPISSNDREHGWTAALGLEYGVTENIIIGVEYNLLHLGVDARSAAAAVPGIRAGDADIEFHSVLARFSYKFGRRPEVVTLK